MATLADLTLDVYDMLFGEAQVQRPVEDTLATEVTNAADVSWRFTTPALWKRGDYAELWKGTGTAGEVVLLTGDHPAAADVTVRRAQRRTTAESGAVAAGAVFLKNPPVTAVMVQRAITETIDNDLYASPHRVFYRSHRYFSPVVGRHRYELAAEDYKVEDVYQVDLSGSAVGAATFDETGGALEDLWTLAGHGLAVGDHVRFSAVGTGAAGYAVDTDYWVVGVPGVDTFRLSATNGGAVIEGTGDSAGTWTLVKQSPSYHRFNVHTWREHIDVNAAVSSTTAALEVDGWLSDDHRVYYTARTRPLASAVASLPDDMADLIPWGAVARLLGSVSVRDRLDPRRRSERDDPSQPFVDASFFRSRFLDMKKSLYNRLIGEKRPQTRFHLPHLAGRT